MSEPFVTKMPEPPTQPHTGAAVGELGGLSAKGASELREKLTILHKRYVEAHELLLSARNEIDLLRDRLEKQSAYVEGFDNALALFFGKPRNEPMQGVGEDVVSHINSFVCRKPNVLKEDLE